MEHDWLIYAGESEGNPLVVMLDKAYGRAYFDASRPWAVMVELVPPRLDGNALPPQADWPDVEAIEAVLVRELATDEDDWKYAVRIMGEGLVRFGFYARRSSAAVQRVASTLAGEAVPAGWGEHRVQVQSDPKWAAYQAFFPGDEKSEGPAPSFRDEPYPNPSSAGQGDRPWPQRRDDQPWRGEESQKHPEE